MSISDSQAGHKVTQQDTPVGRTLQKGEYIIEAVLGHGGMGQVFLGAHAQVDVPVAIKQVHADEPLPPVVIEELDQRLHSKEPPPPSTRGDFPLSGGPNTDRFLREALLLARLRHPAIPLLYDYFLENGCWYLVMEYVPGSTLSSHMREHAPLPPLEAVNYALQICDVLDYLHRQNPPVVFRDLKPANIILHPDGRLMIVDFGIARYFKEGQFNDTTDFGSPGYASPEQYEGTGQTDARSDLYSLGVIIHEMLSGQRPTRRGMHMDHLEPLHKLNPAVSPALSGLVMVATRAEPMYRFQSAHTFYQALERVHAVEERRAYRYHTLMAEITAAQKTPVFPMLIPPPSSQGFLSSELAREQNQRSLHMRMRERTQRNTLRSSLEQEALAHQFTAIDQSLKLRAISSPLKYSGSQPAVMDAFSLNEQQKMAEKTPTAPTPLPQIPPIPCPPSSRPAPRKRRTARTLLSLCILLLLLSASLLAYFYISTASMATHLSLPGTLTSARTRAFQATTSVEPSSVWQSLPALPTQMADNTALYTVSNGQAFIYVTGGFRGNQAAPTYSQGLYRYTIATARWEKVPVANFPLMGNNAAALDQHGNLFFTGGFSPGQNKVSATLYLYQPATNTLSALPVPPQFPLGFGGSMLADGQGHLYLTEGFLTPGVPSAQAGTGWYRYDIASGLWHNLASLPVGLGYVQLAQDSSGNIILLGGSRDAGQREPMTQIYRYSVQQNAWSPLPVTAPNYLSGAEGCTDGQGHLVIIGGYNAALNRSLATAWLFDLRTFKWQALAPLPGGGSLLGTAACDGDGHVYVTRGANDPALPTADFLELKLSK
ncbi:MAG TPA: protein kinase [Ktedonobacteraceae bacterium]|nr:protein kinase [Ktedonobacteraceae bacterium]